MNTQRLFEINTLEQLRDAYELSDAVHSNNFFEVLLITNSGGWLNIDMQQFPLEQQQVFCVQPSQLYQLQVNEATTGYVIRFNEAVFHSENNGMNSLLHTNLLQTVGRSSCIDFEANDFREVIHIIKQLMKEHRQSAVYQAEMVLQYLNILFIYMGRQCKVENDLVAFNCNLRLFKRFISLVDQHFKTSKRVAEYASLMLVTPNHLNHAVRSATGNTAGHFIRQRVVLEAKRQAVYSDWSMKEVAWELGFPDICHFSKFFKKETGDNFTSFKKSRNSFSMAMV